MKIIRCEQNSEEWYAARLGIPTASEFHRIITPGGKPSMQRKTYCYQLLSERMTGKRQEGYKNGWMDRGHELEPEARLYYELEKDVTVERVGLCLTDDGKSGASPDGLVGSYGLFESKNPAPHTHVQYLLHREVDLEYYPQLQGQLWVTGRAWVDVLSYCPGMTPVIIRVERDEYYLKALDVELKGFIGVLDSLDSQLRERGCRFASMEALNA